MLRTVRRSLSFGLGFGVGLVAGSVLIQGTHLTRLMIAGLRQPLDSPPDGADIEVEDVEFMSDDWVRLRGWFVHRAGDDGSPAPAVVIVHGWPWNRTGNHAGAAGLPDRNVDLVGPAGALARAGFHVLMFDLRNHGQSDRHLPVTFGPHEARDFYAAVEFIRTRRQVDGARIGALGYSMGANAMLYGIPWCSSVRAAVAVQPVRVATFARNFARELLGPPGPALVRLAAVLHHALGSPPLDELDPTPEVSRLGDTAVLYIQGYGDRWGSVDEVQAMAAQTPHAEPVILAPSSERYGGYLYVNDHVDDIVAFFREHLMG